MTTSVPYTDLHLQPIAGIWRDGSSTRAIDDANPYNGEVLAKMRLATTQDVDQAYAGAADVQPAWAATAPQERAALMRRVGAVLDARKDEIVDWLIRESGSTVIKATVEWQLVRGLVDEVASFPTRAHGMLLPTANPGEESRVYRHPLGVVLVISPWNFPFYLSFRSVAPAIALGNAVVIKPASDTPITGGTLLAKIFEEAGLPAGALSVVAGAGSEIGDYVVDHEVPKLVSFTGSTAVGKRVGATATGGRWLKRVALELGGNAPIVVLDDADVDLAAEAAVFGRFLHSGQICMSTNRAIVVASVRDAFVDKVLELTRRLGVGDPHEPTTLVGPIINAAQRDSVAAIVAQAAADGATLALGGETQGSVVPPHVYVDVDPTIALATDESFGPILPIITAADEADALRLANQTEYGLSSAVWTSDLTRGARFAQRIVAGMVHVNGITVDDQPMAPFGGEKNSGLGRFNGEWAVEEYTRVQWVTLQDPPHPYGLS